MLFSPGEFTVAIEISLILQLPPIVEFCMVIELFTHNVSFPVDENDLVKVGRAETVMFLVRVVEHPFTVTV